MPADMNAFSVNILSNNTMQGELCGFLTTTGDGRAKSVVVSCDLRPGSAMWMSGTCSNPGAVGPSYYIGFGGRNQIHGPGDAKNKDDAKDKQGPLFQFMWTVKYDKLAIC